MPLPLRPFISALLAAPLASLIAADEDHPTLKGVTPVDDPALAAGKLAVAPGLKATLWAAEPDLENPVSFSFDERGRCFVAETFRRKSSSLDIRRYPPWLGASLAMRTVEDREAFVQTAFSDPKTAPYLGLVDRNGDARLDWRDLAVESERIRLLEDRDSDGRAERSEIFATGFNSAVTGIGAGVLARGPDVFFACLPDVWRLREGRRESIASGFGVHITYSGHDLHGLIFGPDGKLYWTVGDCGARVTTREGRVLDVPDTGAVFRANPDGSECEIVMRGLRNPEELCFNDAGDLFTADNNSDGGDFARWVHVVEGGDAGWQIGFQAQPRRGPWIEERWGSPEAAKTARGLVPPIGTIGHGPAGIAHYPGTGLPEVWRDHFFVCDFPGGVRAFTLRKSGASYTIDAPAAALHDNGYALQHKLVWGFYPTDVEFAPGGGIHVLDWVRDVEKPGKGRIFHLHDAATDASDVVRETQRLLAEGMSARPAAELAALLGHMDRRVRLAAQFALVEKGDAGALGEVAAGTGTLSRIHAVWGLGQMARRDAAVLGPLGKLLSDPDAEIRAQAAKVLGDARARPAGDALATLLTDVEPRVRFFAAIALGKIAAPGAVPGLLAMLRENADADAFLRHAAVIGLAGCADAPTLTAAAADASSAVRVGVALALARQRNAGVARFLRDAEPQLVLEAARAIYDTPIEPAMSELAKLIQQPDLAEAVLLRTINANFFIGDGASARRLAELATSTATETIRTQAVEALGQWNERLGRDRFLGSWRALPVSRDSRAAAAELAKVTSRTFARQAGEKVRLATVVAVGRLQMRELDSAVASIARDGEASVPLRVAALQTLASLSSPLTTDALKLALAAKDETLRAKAQELEARMRPEQAIETASTALKIGGLAEKQTALRTLARLEGKAAEKVLGKWLERLLAGEVTPGLHLDLLEAAATRDGLKEKVAAFERTRPAGRLGPWRECLQGGDAARGREVFTEKAEAGCLRCHAVRGLGGQVGPDLTAIGSRLDRVSILKAIIFPNDTVAGGFETAMLTMKDGTQLVGTVSPEKEGQLVVRTLGDGKVVTVRSADLVHRSPLPSAMPEGLGAVLGKRDLRDVIEFLATQR